MINEQRKAIERLQYLRDDIRLNKSKACELISEEGKYNLANDIDTALSLIKEYQKICEEYCPKETELKQLRKQIDLMAEIFYKRFKAELLLEYGFESEEQLKQYFAGLVEKE